MASSTPDVDQELPTRVGWPAYVLMMLLGTLPLAGLGAYTYYLHLQTASELMDRNQLANATISARMVESEFEHWVGALTSFSQRKSLVAAATTQDEDSAREALEVLVQAHPRVDRAFVTDEAGLLWSDFPKAPESIGRRFNERDWYKGVSANWQPYVSEVYRRNAAPRLLLVAVAVPIRDPANGKVLGAVVYQVQLNKVVEALKTIDTEDEGYTFLLDHTGAVAAHPRLNLQERLFTEYVGTPPFQVDNGGKSRIEYDDPISGEAMHASAVPCTVGGHRWVVVSQQPAGIAQAAAAALVWPIVLAAGVLALLAAGLGAGVARHYVRVRNTLLRENLERVRALASREEQVAHLEKLEADGRITQQELLDAKSALEQQVEQRTKELRTVEEQLLQSQKMEAIGRLAGGIAHDFNNLLSVIIGYGDLVLMRMKPDAPFRAEIEEIRKAGDRAGGLTRQLLAFSRKQVLQPEVLNLNDTVTQMDKMLRRLIGEDIDLATHLEPRLDSVKFDPGQIEQIIVNLVVNARDAMPQGGKITIQTANVELDADYVAEHVDAREGSHVMIAVSDTGVGMDADTRKRIFEPFFTTKALGRGTGLGLSTVYGIVKQSGGNIWVYSEPGRGTTFKVYIPATEQKPVDRSARLAAVRPKATETVLVVEDEEAVRTLVKSVLTGAGYEVLEAATPELAVQRASMHDGDIHLLLTDVVMPGMGGPQLAQKIVSARPTTKVLYMSGYTDNAIVHHGVLDPGTAFLEKPIRPEALQAKVREVLGG